jgi:hypothetical protein
MSLGFGSSFGGCSMSFSSCIITSKNVLNAGLMIQGAQCDELIEKHLVK